MRMHVSIDAWTMKLLSALALLPLSGCGSSTASSQACTDPKPAGNLVECAGDWSHRVQTAACPSMLPQMGTCSADETADTCTTDADCTAKPHGFCSIVDEYEGEFGYCGCTYGCLTDADCGANETCICGSPVGTCVPANCKTDADCGTGALCASVSDGTCGDLAYYCQTTSDQCMTDADCAESGDYCVYDGARRVCATDPCDGIGRPFLVDGRERLSPLAARSDWRAAALEPSMADLDAADREAVAAHWAKVGLMEHASVAAFARFVLQLLSLGAPLDLIRDAQAAMADETRHTEVCFALAGAYAGAPIGPGPLAIDRALESCDARSALITAIHEGCVGETVAALEAAETASRATDPVVRAALSEIAADETRHAELAWRFVRWAISTTPDLAEVAWAAFADALGAAPRARGGANAGALIAHGLPGEELRREIRRRALAGAVAPCARALLDGVGSPGPHAPNFLQIPS